MSLESAREHLAKYGLLDAVIVYDVSTATVEEASAASGLEPGQIGKTMAFDVRGETVLVLCGGDARVANPAFKAQFHTKPVFIKPDDLVERVGHPMGGVCPFGVKPSVTCYLDESLRRYDFVRPAAGATNTGVDVPVDRLSEVCGGAEWIDVCKGWREEE